MTPTVSILPEILISTEGDSLVRNITLDQPVPEGGLTLNLVVAQSTESPDGDLIINLETSSGITDFNGLIVDDVALGVTVTLAEGITEALLVADTVADDILETDEISSLSLADGENYRANPEQNNIFTVLTDRTVVTLTTDEVNVTEGDTFAWNFSLNQPAPEGGLTLSLPITLNNDPEPGDVDYNIEGSTNIEDFGFIIEDDVSIGFTLTIPEGETVATLVSEAVIDDIAEFDEIFTTVLADGNDYVANPVSNQVVTTIAEDGVAPPSSAPVVSITPEILISTEGDTFAWDITLDQPVPEGGLTLNLPITQNNDPEPGDVIYNVEGSTGITDFDFIVEDNISIGFSVTLAEGVTSATLVSEAVADDNDIEEAADEIFTTVLADGVDYRANPDSNEVVTVLTREPVVTFTPEQVNVTEGDTFAWNFSLNRPAPEGGLDLLLPITFNNDPEPGDVFYNVEGSTNITDFSFLVIDNVSLGFSLTIAEGETVATLVSQAVADDLEEIDEIFTTILADGGNYRANPVSREVVTTIVEQDSSSTPVVSVIAEPTIFAENGGMGSFIITLSEPAPEEGLEIKFEAVDEDGMQGDSEVALENISDIEIITDGSNPSFLIVEPGATEAKLMFTGIPDGVPEGEELSAFTILEGEGYTIDSNQSSANIVVTDLPIVSLSAEPTNVNEGEQLKFNFELTEAAPMGGLTVNLDLVEDTDPLPGDITYFVEGSENITDFELLVNDDTGLIDGATVTIAEGATSATLLNDIIADNNTEGPESVQFGLAEGDYSIDSDENAASFTIVDTSTAASFIQQDLFFGRGLPDGGEVSESEFQTFVDETIAPRFFGLTVFDAQGQVQDGEGNVSTEASKVVTLILEDTPENADAVEEVFVAYEQQFEGAGTLQVTNRDDFQVSFGPEDIIDNDPEPELIQANLFFGRSFSGGEVSESEFQTFVDEIVSPRVIGLTLLDAQGQVTDADGNILREPSQVISLILEDTEANETVLNEILTAYQEQFEGAGVLQTVNEDVAVSFGPAEDIIDNDAEPELIQADLFFGRDIPNNGEVSESEFQAFVDQSIAPRFPGLTLFDAQGQVTDAQGNILSEPSQIVRLIVEDTEANEALINQVLSEYQEQFNGAGVLQVIDEDVETSLDTSTAEPTISANVEPDVVTENSDQYSLTLNLSEPAPMGGLRVVFSETDSDNAFGDIEFPPELTNASNFESLDPVIIDADNDQTNFAEYSGSNFSVSLVAEQNPGPGVPQEILDRFGNLRDTNQFILQDATDPDNTALIFDGPDGAGTTVNVEITEEGVVLVDGEEVATGFEDNFYFGLINNIGDPDGLADSYTFSTNNSLNQALVAEGEPQFVTYLQEDGSYVIGAEELPFSISNQDFDDHIVKVDGVSPVGEPQPNVTFNSGTLQPVFDSFELARSAITIDEGATEAIVTWTTIPDNQTEGEETTTIELEAAEGYNIDPDNQSDIVTILDTSIATGDETIVGDESDEVLDGKDGDDLIAGGFGNDQILGGEGDDVLRGDLNSRSPGGTVGGNDTISGGSGDDRIGGKAGDDELYGDEGHDSIWGDDGDDLIRGGLGNDILIGDNFSGGSGADTFVLAAGEGTDTIVDFEVGVDIIGLADGLMAGDLTVTTSSGNTAIALGDETLAILEGVVVSGDDIDFALV